MILLIDNYDSFTYNICQYLRVLGFDVDVKRNDEISIDEIEQKSPSHIVISPGPGNPDKAGISVDVIKEFKGRIPILGVCLGHQCIGAALGAKIQKAKEIYHGKTSEITHDGKTIFKDMKNPMTATRYHSLVIDKLSLPDELEISAVSEAGEIMAVRHKTYTIEGVQFHPESIATECGCQIFENFLSDLDKPSIMKTSMNKIYSKGDLTEEEAAELMNLITSGEATDAQIAGILTALSMKGESIQELIGFVKVMREKAIKIDKPKSKIVVDTCGTGGDGAGTFNISTVAAFVAAGAGVCVAKHGNRSITSRCGSADLLEALGVNILIEPGKIVSALCDIGIAFLFAPRLHPSMKNVASARREIGIRTVFNILGPLANPANVDRQVIGVFDADITEKMAFVLSGLGTKRAMVVHGFDGLDEITLTGKTKISEVRDGWVKTCTFKPEDYGYRHCTLDALKGGDLKSNSEIALSILERERGARRDIVVLNAAAAIFTAGITDDFKEACSLAEKSIDEGRAMAKLEQLIDFTGE